MLTWKMYHFEAEAWAALPKQDRRNTMKNILIAIGIFATLTFFTGASVAQTNQVRCINLLDGKTVQIFMTMQCPRGWAPV